MGFLSRAMQPPPPMPQYGGPMAMKPNSGMHQSDPMRPGMGPQMPMQPPMPMPQYGGMMGAFSQNPQFQQQLQALMQQQGPGNMPIPRIPVPEPMPIGPQGGPGGAGGAQNTPFGLTGFLGGGRLRGF